MNKYNYSNATLLMSLYHCYWSSKKFPFMHIFHHHLTAFSEEKGESSIHLLLKQIRNHMIDYDVLSEKFRNITVFNKCSEIYSFSLSRKQCSTKKFEMKNYQNVDDNIQFKIFTNFSTQLYLILNDQFDIFCSNKSYKSSSMKDNSLDMCTTLYDNYKQSQNLCAANCNKLFAKVKKPFKKPDYWPFLLDNLVWK